MFVRPLLSAVLCCVVAFGHAPAWLHVATCGSGGSVVGDRCDSNSGGHCGCKHTNPFADRSASKPSLAPQHTGDPQELPSDADSESSPDSGRPIGDHSSDDCVICHSLMSAIGNIDLGPIAGVVQQSFFLASFSPCGVLSEGTCRALHLRGPPIL